MILKHDCRHFPGDRPCIPHKETGIKCDTCSQYEPVKSRILIVKFDALGDVLRTTCLLPSLARAFPGKLITWLTKSNAVDLFRNNPLVHEVWKIEDPSTLARLSSVEFDLVVHPDANPVSGYFASLARTKVIRGFSIGTNGKVYPTHKEAEEWFELGAFDDLKKINSKSYQRIIHEIAGIPYEGSEIMVRLDAVEKENARRFILNHKLEGYRHVVGLNTGAGGRWTYKKWTLDGYRGLIRELLKRSDTAILLYGGPEEEERNRALAAMSPKVIDTGTDNSLRDFFALMSIPTVVVTGDTMALHVAAAFSKPTVCLFGPTSANEIEDYGIIIKVQPDLDCLVCYKMNCDFVPNCMESISVPMVLDAIDRASKPR